MPKAVFAGIARDCADQLPAVLENIDRLAAIFEDAAFVFVENDSRDATRTLLEAWGRAKPKFTLFNLAGLGKLPVRTLRLEVARNVYLESLKTDATLDGFDYLCVMDMDHISTRPIDLTEFKSALAFMSLREDCAGVFANQIGDYYDMWALRHPEYSPGDAWYEVFQYANAHGVSDQEAYDQTFARRIRSFDRASAPVEVESAFGGLGLYRLSYVRRNPNPYLGGRVRVLRGADGQPTVYRTQQCEHVHFHEGLRQLGGRLFILPTLINAVIEEKLQKLAPASACRGILF